MQVERTRKSKRKRKSRSSLTKSRSASKSTSKSTSNKSRSSKRSKTKHHTNEQGLVSDPTNSEQMNWITSYGSQYVREWLKANNGYYGEIRGQKNCTLKFNGMPVKGYENVSLRSFETKLRELKPTHICIVKSEVAVSDYYAKHWYFQSPHSPNDTCRSVGKPQKTLTNSYSLDWQISKTDQFCMLYAFYGATQPKEYWEDHSKDPYFDFKQVPYHADNSALDVAGKEYYSLSQNHNTKKLMQFFLNHITSEQSKVSNVLSVTNRKRLNASSVKFSIQELKDKLKEAIDHPELFKPLWKAN